MHQIRAGHCLPSTPPISTGSNIPRIDMLEPQHSASRKRQRSELLQRKETSPPSKKQRLGPPSPSGSSLPPEFWDRLSKLWLTRQALRELDRRNTQRAPSRREAARHTADYRRCRKLRISKDIKLFARHGGPDLSDLRNCSEPIYPSDQTMSSGQSSAQSRGRGTATASSTRPTEPTTNTTKTKSTGVYDRNFQQHITDHNIYPYAFKHPDGSRPARPSNWEDFNQILTQPRPSLSPSRFSDGQFTRFTEANADAAKEKQVSESVIPVIEGRIADAECRSGGIPFTNLSPLTDGTLKPGNPDVFYGASPGQLNRKVRNKLGGQIIPSTQHDLPIAPNFSLAVKGPNGTSAVAKRQACYDGALGARGMRSLQAYGQDNPPYGNASTLTSIYQNGTLEMYSSHAAQPKNSEGRTEYHMSLINSWSMTGNIDSFREATGAYRNGRDWARLRRDELINGANERAHSHVETETLNGDAVANPVSSSMAAASETEAYTMSQESNVDSIIRADLRESETSIDDRVPAKRSGRQPKRPSTQRKRRNACVPAGANLGGANLGGAGLSDASAVTSVSRGSAAIHVATEPSERWSWANGIFQCHKGPNLIKEQRETPDDVWIYCDAGWPRQKGKKWRLWTLATQEILYA